MKVKSVDPGAILLFLPSFNHKAPSKVAFAGGWARSSGTEVNSRERNLPNHAEVWIGGTAEGVFDFFLLGGKKPKSVPLGNDFLKRGGKAGGPLCIGTRVTG